MDSNRRRVGTRAAGRLRLRARVPAVSRACPDLFDAAIPAHRLTRLHRETLVQAPLDQTFSFFADASNLQRLTPSWLHFSIRTPMPIDMRPGAEIAYRLRLYGIPIPWTSRIDVWEPGVCFVDRQIVGPYRWWRHEHRFEPAGTATRVVDIVEYLPRAAWITRRVVRRDVEQIFEYRQHALQQIFGNRRRDGAVL